MTLRKFVIFGGVLILGAVGLVSCTSCGTAERLMASISQGDAAEVEQLLDSGTDPNCSVVQWSTPISVLLGARTRQRMTPLMRAARLGDETIVRLLLESGADPSFLPRGETLPALVRVIRPNASFNPAIAILLVEHGADPFQPIFTEAPIIAWTIGPRTFPVFRALTVSSIRRDRAGELQSALPDLITGAGKMPTPYWSAYVREVDRLLSTQDRTGAIEDGVAALMYAILVGDIGEVDDILREGSAGITEVTPTGWTPLAWALVSGDTAIVARLGDTGAGNSQSAVSAWGATRLLCAVHGGDVSAVRAVLAMDPESLDVLDDNGCSALALSLYRGNGDIIDLLLEAGADVEVGVLRGRSTAEHLASWREMERRELVRLERLGG